MNKDHINDKFKYRGKEYCVGTKYTIDMKEYYQFIGITEQGNYHFVCLTPYVGSVIVYPPDIDKYDLIIVECDTPQLLKTGTAYIDTTVGWVWYIIIMLLLVLFKDRIVGWVITTIIFLAWRKNKLKGE